MILRKCDVSVKAQGDHHYHDLGYAVSERCRRAFKDGGSITGKNGQNSAESDLRPDVILILDEKWEQHTGSERE